MPRVHLHRVAALGLGIGAGGALFWFGIDVLLSVAVAVALAVSVALRLRTNREHPEVWSGDSRANDRWTIVSLAVTNFAALVGVQRLPLSAGYNAAISFLIIFVGFAGYLGGILAAKARDRPGGNPPVENAAVAESD